MSDTSSEEIPCKQCSTRGTFADGDGLCPACLLETALMTEDLHEDDEEPVIRESCGDYQILRMIGRGGNGLVFLAKKHGADRPVALKMLASARVAGPDDLRRFRLEISAAAQLDHPHIIRVHDSGEDQGAPWFTMQYAAGGSLADQLNADKSPETLQHHLRTRVAMMAKVARAVHFAHERGVLHRDLKPANILIDEAGNALVADFGLARMLHQPSGVTMTGAALGTPGYMAPEQAAGTEVTTAADVYGLGAVLYQVLTGKPPFEAPTPLETLRLVTSQDALDPRSSATWIDQDLAMICLKALRRERTARYSSADAMAQDLDAWLRGEPVTARPLPWSEKIVKWCRRRPITATLLAASLVAAFALTAVLITGSMMLREQRNIALEQKATAVMHAQAATQARDDSRLHSYAADMYLAFRAFDDGHLGLARRMLARQQPHDDLPDLRGFEWHALTRRCQGDDLQSWHDHQGAVCTVAFAPQGNMLASGSRDGLLKIRSIPDGRTILSLPKADTPRGIAEIPLMTTIASRSAETTQLLLAARITPDEMRMRARPSKLGEITSLAWSPDGQILATAGLGSYVRLWTMPAGELSGIIPVRTVKSLHFSADGTWIIVYLHSDDGNDHECRIYRAADLSLHHTLTNLQAPHAVSPFDGTIATIAKNTFEVCLTDPLTKKVRHTLQPGLALQRLVFSRDGAFLHGVDATGFTAGTWTIATGARSGLLYPVAGKFDLLEPSPDGQSFASTGSGQHLAWQHKLGNAPAVMFHGHEDTIRAIAISPNGKWIASGGNDHSVRLWQVAPRDVTNRGNDPFQQQQLPEALRPRISEKTRYTRTNVGILLGSDNPYDSLQWLNEQGTSLRTIKPPGGKYLRLASSPTGDHIAAFYWPRAVRVYSTSTATWSKDWMLSSGTVGPIVFSPDGSLLASGGDDNTISIRDTIDGRLIAQLKGHQGSIIDLAFTPDGRTLASIAEDNTLRLWHCPTWRDLGTLHKGERLSRLQFRPDGKILYAAATEGWREFGETPAEP